MSGNTFVACHPPFLSLLLFETVCSSNNQKGILLGEVKKQVFVTATDENEADEEEKTVIYIEQFVPIDEFVMFGPYGEISHAFMRKFASCSDKIVGWYSFRRNIVSTRCTVKETLIHRTLNSALNITSPSNFVLALLSSNLHLRQSTHSFCHTFYRMNPRGMFEPLKLKIYSVSDKVTNSSGYQLNTTFPTSSNFNKIISQIEATGGSMSSLHNVQMINKLANDCLAQASNNIVAIEGTRANLQREVDELREKLGYHLIEPTMKSFTPVVRKPPLTPRFEVYDSSKRYNKSRSRQVITVIDDELPSDTEDDLKRKSPATANEIGDTCTSVTPAFSYASAVNRQSRNIESSSTQISATYEGENSRDKMDL